MPAGMNSRISVFSPSTLMATLSTGGPPIRTRSRGRPNSSSVTLCSLASVTRRSRLPSAVSVTTAHDCLSSGPTNSPRRRLIASIFRQVNRRLGQPWPAIAGRSRTLLEQRAAQWPRPSDRAC